MIRKRCSKNKEDCTNDDLSDLSFSDPDDKEDLRMYLKSSKNSRSSSSRSKSRKVESKQNSRDSTGHTSSKQHSRDYDRNQIRIQFENSNSSYGYDNLVMILVQ